jgi:hypothetical protein
MDQRMVNTLEERKVLDMPIASTVSMRKLGPTEISVTPVGLGMMEFAGGNGLMSFVFLVIRQEEKNATVRAGRIPGLHRDKGPEELAWPRGVAVSLPPQIQAPLQVGMAYLSSTQA